jgi:hypothetical protein
MAELHIFADDRDVRDLWDLLLCELHLLATPDPFFGHLPVPTCSTPFEVAENVRLYPRVSPGLGYFLTSLEWSHEALQHHQCTDNPHFQPHWNVSPRVGGPSIHFICRFGYPWHNKAGQLVGGLFSHYPYYYSSAAASTIIERPEAMLYTMSQIKAWLLERGQYVVSPCRKRAIVMPGALAAHQNGVVLRLGDIVFAANPQGGANRRQPSRSGRNRTSAAAASRRSP